MFGTLQDLRGLRGEAGLSRLSMLAAGGDIGGPIVANNNVVIGMLPPPPKPKCTGTNCICPVCHRQQRFIYLAKAANVTIEAPNSTTKRLAPEELTLRASEFTVLMQC